MEILEGLFLINGIDVYASYGVFLSESNQEDMSNYNQLLKPAPSKEHISVNFREEDGEKYPDVLMTKLSGRDVELQFTMEAESRTVFFTRYSDFMTLLKTGDNGWLTLKLTDIDRSFRVFYLDCTGWQQLTDFEGKVYASFKIKFREPNPKY